MSYALSFAPEFFWGDGSVSPEDMRPSNRPTCVYQALLSLSDDEWAALAADVFQVAPDDLDPAMVLEKIFETNTCQNLDSPVEVCIEDWYSVRVYESRKEEP